MTDEKFLPMVDAIRPHRSLRKLRLHDNSIGRAGCEALATLLEDTDCNLQIIDLGSNDINNEGVTTLANSLANNTKLKHLYLDSNPIGQDVLKDVFSRFATRQAPTRFTFPITQLKH